MNHDGLFDAGPGERGDVEGEARRTALMPSGLPPVDPDGCRIVDCAEMQQDGFPGPFRGDGEAPRIENRLDEVGVTDAGERALRAERHENGAVVRIGFLLPVPFDAGFAEVEPAAPFAVQIEPGILPAELHPGVFGTRNGTHSTRASCIKIVSCRNNSTMS